MNISYFWARFFEDKWNAVVPEKLVMFTGAAKQTRSAKEAADELNLFQSNWKEPSNHIYIVHVKNPTTNTHTFWMTQYFGMISFHMHYTSRFLYMPYISLGQNLY